MEFLCAALFVLGLLVSAAVGAWVILAAVFRATAGDTPTNRPPTRRARYTECPACDAQLQPADRACPECGVPLDGALAGRLHRVRKAEQEVESLRAAGELDADTAAHVLDRLADRRVKLLQAEEADHPKPVSPIAPVARPLPVARPVAPPVPSPEPVTVAAETPQTPTVDAPARVEPQRQTLGGWLAEFMHERNILWGELTGGVLIVGCSIALVLSLWRSLESLPYFPFLLSSGITAALFGAGQYTLHHWRLTATSRGLLVIALLLAPLNLLLLTDPVSRGAVGWVDAAVKVAAVLLFAAGVRTAGRDVLADALPGPIGGRWLLTLAVVGAPATLLWPVGTSPLAPYWEWLPMTCYLFACVAVLMFAGSRYSRPGSDPMGGREASAVLLFTGLAAFALLVSWGAGVAQAAEWAEVARGLGFPLVPAATPMVAAGLLVHRRLLEPIGLRVTGTAVALVGSVVMVSGVVLAWPDPVTVLAAAAAAGVALSGFAFRDRLVWMHFAALPNLALAFLLAVIGVGGGWITPPEADTSAWLATRLTSVESAAALAVFAAVLACAAHILAAVARPVDARGYAAGGVAAVVAALFAGTIRGVDSPLTVVWVHVLGGGVLLIANARWRIRVLTEAGVWLLLPATLWFLWAIQPEARGEWGRTVAVEGLALAAIAWALRSWNGTHWFLGQLRGACANTAAAAAILAVTIGLTTEGMPDAPIHTGTLFAVAAIAFILADVFAAGWVTWVASGVLLVGLGHLTGITLDIRPHRLAALVALVGHAAAVVGGAVVFRQRGDRNRVLAEPLRWSGRLTSCLAVPLLALPDPAQALAWAGLAATLGVVWLVLALVWRERGGFPVFQGAVFAAAVLVAVAWVHSTPWLMASSLGYADPRAMQAYGIAIGLAGLAWVLARRLTGRCETVQAVWSAVRPSADRVVIGAVVVIQLVIVTAGVFPSVVAELTPLGTAVSVVGPAELAHTWGPGAWALLGMLALVMAAELRVPPRRDRRRDGPVIGLSLLALTIPVLIAGAFTPDIAAASALRWGLAAAFLLGAAAVVARAVLRRAARFIGIWVRGRRALPAGYGLLTAIAIGVVVLTANVAELGLSGLSPSGPATGSVFARMGWTASHVVPLALLVVGLAGLAFRDRAPVAALAGGGIFAATLAGGYALAVVTGGGSLGTVEQVRVVLLGTAGAAVWALLWLAVEWRVPGRGGLTAVIAVALAGVTLLAVIPLARMLLEPGVPLGPTSAELGLFGWTTLLLAGAACYWHVDRAAPRFRTAVLGWAGGVAGVLAGCAAQRWDTPGAWVSFHALAAGWAIAGMALTAVLIGPGRMTGRAWSASAWPSVFAAGLALLALRGGWADPGRPLAPAGAALFGSLLTGTMALWFGSSRRVAYTVVLFGLAAVLVWVAEGPPTEAGFALSVATGLGLAAGVWAVVTRAAGRDPVGGRVITQATAWVGLVAAIGGLLPTLAGERAEPLGLAWGTTVAVGLGLLATVWASDHRATASGLYLLGVAAVLLAVAGVYPEPVWTVWPTPLALAGFAATAAAVVVALHAKLEDPDRPTAGLGWFDAVQAAIAVAVVTLAVGVALREPSLGTRLVGPFSLAILVPAAVLTNRIRRPYGVSVIQASCIGFGIAAVALIGWAVPDPMDPVVWLRRNGWMFAALVAGAVVAAEVFPRLLSPSWSRAAGRAGRVAAAGAVVVILIHQIQQALAFDTVTRRTPLDLAAVAAGVLGLIALVVLALRFALRSDRDPLGFSAVGRAGSVYIAGLLVVLVFVEIRLNIPELFHGLAARYWTFIVMLLAFAVAGAAEVFDRRGLAVLAAPLRRTGVLLPLVPLLAFWARPPATILAMADDHAPGLRPMLGYLERLPQHFDTYALLWLLAGMLYGLLAASRRSFGWALLAALAANAGVWAMLTHHEVPVVVHPQAWVIPLALIVLVSEHIHRHRLRPEASVGLRYLGVAMIYVASAVDMFIAGVGQSLWLPVVLAVLCLTGVLLGILLRVRAFLFLGVGFLLLDVFAMVWHAAVNREQTWVWYVSGIVLGVAILALFAALEKRRKDLLDVVTRVRQWD